MENQFLQSDKRGNFVHADRIVLDSTAYVTAQVNGAITTASTALDIR